MDLKNIPPCPFEQRAWLFLESASAVTSASALYAREKYHQSVLLKNCMDFVEDDLLDTARSDWDSLGRIWLFPVREAHGELELALTACLTGMYKSVFDHLRRAVEVVVVGSYFLMEHVSALDARAWLSSKTETPLFSRAVRGLTQNDRFAGLEKSCGWLTELKRFYWHLCDPVHVRGSDYSLDKMQPSSYSYNGIRTLTFSPAHLSSCLVNIYSQSVISPFAVQRRTPYYWLACQSKKSLESTDLCQVTLLPLKPMLSGNFS